MKSELERDTVTLWLGSGRDAGVAADNLRDELSRRATDGTRFERVTAIHPVDSFPSRDVVLRRHGVRALPETDIELEEAIELLANAAHKCGAL